MKTMIQFFKNEDGATAIEYALIAALIAIVSITMMGNVGGQINNSFSKVNSALSSANR